MEMVMSQYSTKLKSGTTKLTEQFRFNYRIQRFNSEHFYNGKLTAHPSNRNFFFTYINLFMS